MESWKNFKKMIIIKSGSKRSKVTKTCKEKGVLRSKIQKKGPRGPTLMAAWPTTPRAALCSPSHPMAPLTRRPTESRMAAGFIRGLKGLSDGFSILFDSTFVYHF